MYLGARTQSALYIEPDVLKREKKAGNAPKDREGGKRDQPTPGPLPEDAREIGERPALHDGEIERRVKWAEEREVLRFSNRRCAVILAPPGQGKSQLGRMTAAKLADESWQGLHDRTVAVSEMPLPVFLTFEELTSREMQPDDSDEDAFRNALTAALRTKYAHAADYIARHAHDQRTWVFLDALDELPDDRRGLLATFLSVLAVWQCRIVLTSRPYAYNDHSLPFASETYRLPELSTQQQQDFLDRWFAESEQPHRMRTLLRDSSSIQRMCENPYLLTMLCWLGERHVLSPDITRTGIYDLLIVDVLGLPQGGIGMVDVRRGYELKPLLAEVAFDWFRTNKGMKALAVRQLLELLKTVRDRPTPRGEATSSKAQEADRWLAELREKRLLIPFQADNSLYWIPHHRSILEYLTACALADRLTSPKPKTSQRYLKFPAQLN